ncbi:hypothetical protein ACOMHN_049639 [Nucella lapillus]
MNPSISWRLFVAASLGMFLHYAAAERKVHNVTNIACKPAGENVTITDAHFLQPLTSCNCCQPVSREDPQSGCSFEGNKCYSRFTHHQLNELYKALDSQDDKMLSAVEEELGGGDYRVKFLCFVENQTVDPCHSYRGQQMDAKYTSLSVRPSGQSSACRKICRLSSGPFKVRSTFLLQGSANSSTNYLEYGLVENGKDSEPKCNITGFYEGDSFIIVGLWVRIHLEDLSHLTRLWLDLQGNEFSISCEEEGEGGGGGRGTTNVLQPTHSGTHTPPSEQPRTQLNKASVPYIAVGVSVALFIIFCLAGLLYYRRKRQWDEESSCQRPTQLSAVPASDYEDVIPDCDSGVNTSRDQHVTRGDHSAALDGNVTGSGSDDGQYGRMVREGRRGESDGVSHSDVYDRATSPQPSASAPTAESASQEESDVYHGLHLQPVKQTVVDNTYDYPLNASVLT